MSAARPDDVLSRGTPPEARRQNLEAGAAALAGGAKGPARRTGVLLIGAASLMTSGITVIALGWVGASRSTLVEEQIPYLISGGLLGVALALLGAVLLLAHWLTVAVREARVHEAARRRDHAELLATLKALAGIPDSENPNGTAGSTRRQRQVRRPSGAP